MKTISLAIILAATAAMPAAATASSHVYMTGTNAPWGIDASNPGSPEAGMNRALGAGTWTSVFGFTTDAFAGAAFVYLDGGDSAGLADFLNAGGRDVIEAFVQAGGAVLVNAARNDSYAPINAGFGLTLTGQQFSDSGQLTTTGTAAGLGTAGAGSSWTGNWFSHDAVTCEADLCNSALSLIDGNLGSTLMGGAFGEGYLLVGGMTAPYWQSEGGDQLRANMIALTAGKGELMSGAVPEPTTWAMLIAGFGLVGASARRRRGAALTRLS